MPNPNPKTEQLALGRGKRPKLNNSTVGMRMSPATKQALESIAKSYNCLYGGKPWIAGLLEKIGAGELLVVPAPPPLPRFDPKQTMKEHLANKHFSASSGHGSTDHGEDMADGASRTRMSQHPG